jgi:DNA gyrase subunit A
LNEYKNQNRSGTGIKTYNVSSKTGEVVTTRLIKLKESIDLLIATEKGNIIRLNTKQVPIQGRSTIGVKLVKLSPNDKVTSAAFIADDEDIE